MLLPGIIFLVAGFLAFATGTSWGTFGILIPICISVFKTEGNLITMAGAVIGLVFGTLICLLQEKYGLITLGDGSYIITAYPVKIVFEDILLIVLAVLSIGYTASYFPVKYLVNKLAK